MQLKVIPAQDPMGDDRFYIYDENANLVDGGYDTHEEATARLRLLTAQTMLLFDVEVMDPDDHAWAIPVWAEDAAEALSKFADRVGDDLLAQKVEVRMADMAIRRERAADHPLRCCGLAVFYPCVCNVAFSCPLHGETHHGTHD